MIVWIIFAAVIIYVLTLGIMLYVTAKDEDFECVGDLFEWVYRYDPVVLIPIINTICLVFTVILCPILWLFNKIGQIKLPQKAKCLQEKVSDLLYPTIAELGGIESAIEQAWQELSGFQRERSRTTGYSVYESYHFVARRTLEIIMERNKTTK